MVAAAIQLAIAPSPRVSTPEREPGQFRSSRCHYHEHFSVRARI